MVEAIAQAPPGLVEQVITAPWIYLLLISIVCYFILTRGNKQRPEQKPFYGAEVRADVTNKKLLEHVEAWGEKPSKFNLWRGMNKVGVIHRLDPIYKHPNATEIKDLKVAPDALLETYVVAFRKAGLWNYLKAMLFKKYAKLLIDPKGISIDRKNKQIIIDPKVHLIMDSGVWTIATNKELKIVDDLNLKLDHENVKGFVSDFPRRLSNLDPGQSIKTEQISHIYAEEEKAKKARIGHWAGKQS